MKRVRTQSTQGGISATAFCEPASTAPVVTETVSYWDTERSLGSGKYKESLDSYTTSRDFVRAPRGGRQPVEDR